MIKRRNILLSLTSVLFMPAVVRASSLMKVKQPPILISLNNRKLLGLCDPVAYTEIATKYYVDHIVNSLKPYPKQLEIAMNYYGDYLDMTATSIASDLGLHIDGQKVNLNDTLLYRSAVDVISNGLYHVSVINGVNVELKKL